MSARQGAERLIIVANFHSKCFSLVSQAVCCASQSAPGGFMEVPKQRARCGPQHCVLGLADTDTQAEGGNYQHSLWPAVAYESYRTRRQRGRWGGEVSQRQSGLWRATAAREEESVLTFQGKLAVRLPTLLPAMIFGGERVVLV